MKILKNSNQSASVFPAWTAAVSDPARIVGDPTGCSRYRQVLLLEDTRAAFSIPVAQPGTYGLVFSYYAPHQDLCQFLYVNGVCHKIGFNRCFQGWQTITYDVVLQSGDNELVLYSKGIQQDCESGTVYIESLSLQVFNTETPEVLYTLPAVYPRTNFLYNTLGKKLDYIVLDPETLHQVRLDGKPLPFQVRRDVMRDGGLHFFRQENVRVDFSQLTNLTQGDHRLTFDYGENQMDSRLVAQTAPAPCGMTITFIDVGHGCSILIRLPDQTFMLVDTGYEPMTRERVIPFLQANGVRTLTYYVTTHYDADHAGGKALIESSFFVENTIDCYSWHTGDTFCLGGTEWEILNAHTAGDDLNRNSLSFRLTYNGFVYVHGGDIYAENQKEILRRVPEKVRCHVYHANHHFFGSLDPFYLRKANPFLFIMGVNVHCYSKSAHVNHFLQDVEGYLKSHQGRLIETIRGYQCGNVTLRINSGDDFTYETYRQNDENRGL